MSLFYGRETGATLWNGQPHRQPRCIRRAYCVARHYGHRPKFGAHPRGSCIYCGYWADNRR